MGDYRTMRAAEQMQKNKTQQVFCSDMDGMAPVSGESAKMSDLSMTLSQRPRERQLTMDNGRLLTEQLLLKQSSTGDQLLVGGIEYQDRRATDRQNSPSINAMNYKAMK